MHFNKIIAESKLNVVIYIILTLILCSVLYVRIRLLNVPLERDEGEYAYMGQLLLKGIAPFAEAYTMKLPGVSILYALFMALFGQTIAGIHLGLLLVNGACIFLIYLLARRLLGREAAVITCSAYAVLSLSHSVLGIFAHATHFVVLFSLSGFVLLFRYLDRGRALTLFFSALCLGLAIIMKQHAAMLAGYTFFYFMWRGWKDCNTSTNRLIAGGTVFLSGIVIPYALVALYVFNAGTFDTFWFWTVQYARSYVSEMTLAQGWSYFYANFGRIVTAQLPFFIMSGVGGYALCSKKRRDADGLFILGFFLFSLLAICPGWYFRPHYFVMLLPAIALLAGAVVAYAPDFLRLSINAKTIQQLILAVLLITAAAYSYYQENEYYIYNSPRQVSRACYALSPFPEALPIARYIKNHTSPNDRIAVLGSEPEIFFYADRFSATRHIYMYGLMENQPYAIRMQQEMIREIETAKPKYIVMTNIVSSWFAFRPSSSAIIDWGEKYVREKYDVVGVTDIIDYDSSQILWDDNAKKYKPTAENFLTILKRKNTE